MLKICFKPILMHIYGMQYDFMHRSCWNHSNFENSWFYNVISTSDPQNHCLLGSRNRVAVNFLNRYVIYWVVPCERTRPELSEYVWHAVGKSQPFQWENSFCPKTTPQNSLSGVKKIHSSEFGRSWRLNPYLIFVIFLHRQKFWTENFTPKNALITANGFRDKIA